MSRSGDATSTHRVHGAFELVEDIEEERAIHQRERERRDAAVWTRMKWWCSAALESIHPSPAP